jgi:diguanylate cyclase (GGDEF)-like protein
LTGTTRVWLLTAAIAPCAVGLGWLVARLPTEPTTVARVVVFAGLFYLAEITVVHIRFRRDAHSFSMSELPLVLALFFLPAGVLIACQLVGSALALGVNRRQRPVKLAFNLTQLSLQTSVTVGAFWLVAGDAGPLQPRAWGAIALGVTGSLLVSNALIGAAIRLSGGSLSRSDRMTMYTLSGGAGLMNGALGLVAAAVVWAGPTGAVIAALPPVILFFAYRAYLSQRLERDRLQALYEASGELHRLPRIEDALQAAVERARMMFDAETATILLHPDGLDRPGFVTLATADGATTVMQPAVPMDRAGDIGAVVASGVATLLRRRERTYGMAVAIPAAEAAVGVMTVEIPLSDIGSFGENDLRLLETLAGHVGVSLENGRLEDSLARLTELKDQLRHQALHDGLTGLANRTLLRDQLARVLASPDSAHRAAVLFLDLDDFKAVNDTHGHAVGDRMLAEVGRRLLVCSRPTDTVARLGGDEFALLLDAMSSPDDAVVVAKRIIEILAEPFEVSGGTIETHASIGLAVISGGEEPDEVLRYADEAMYVAKGEGKGTYRLHTPGMRSRQSHELATVAGLRDAIRGSQLLLHYQPIFDLTDGGIVSVEALVRWMDPERGLIGPDQFVPLAERRGLIDEMGRWVLRTAADTLDRWSRLLGERTPSLSVNLSAGELQRSDLVPLIRDLLAARGLDPSLLQIEITESGLLESPTAVLSELRHDGIRVALDDFGTGYSSLAYLDRLPIDTIKLDRSFLARISDPKVEALVEMMIGFGRRLGFDTVVEGIETATQLDLVRHLGCRLGQGFHLSRPLPDDEILPLLAQRKAVDGVLALESA